MPPDRQPLTGRAEICKYYETATSSGVEVEYDLNHIETEGNLTWVAALAHWDADGQRRSMAFMDVWRRENGKWRVAACIGNSSDGFTIA
jgi:ketosteroid isomerase-like protein